MRGGVERVWRGKRRMRWGRGRRRRMRGEVERGEEGRRERIGGGVRGKAEREMERRRRRGKVLRLFQNQKTQKNVYIYMFVCT